jgi:hypothetical protein
MKNIALVMLIALSLVATACGASTQGPGPSAWLDRPLDGDKVPLEPLTIQAHASDADGVARFEFFIGETPLVTVPGSGSRFSEAEAGWTPSVPGSYTVRARAIDGKGNVGPEAIARIAVGELMQTPTTPTDTPKPPMPTYMPTGAAKPPTPTYTPTGTAKPPTPTYTPTGTAKPPTPTYTPTPTGTPTMPPPPPADIQFWADSDNIPAGSCTTVHWHVAHVKAYWVDGHPGAGDDGSFQACPCQEETHTLHVAKVDGSEQDLAVTIHVSGECAAPPPPPPPTEGPPPPPPQDTTGPDISGIGVTKEGCNFYGYANVSDPSGVAWAQFYYRLGGGGWQNVGMNEEGYGYFKTGDISVGEGVVSIEYYVKAGDSPGNQSESGHANDNVGCIK